MSPSELDDEVYARVVAQLDLAGLRQLQRELSVGFVERRLGGSVQECRAMANALIERALRSFADRVTGHLERAEEGIAR